MRKTAIRSVPIYFYPNLKFFNIPNGTPEDVVDEVNKSFALFFSDPSSAVSHIRISLEYLLNNLTIKRYINTGKGRKYLALHNRIDLLPKRYDHVKELFLAVKWIGNAGSHSNKEVGKNNVFDCYELMSELLSEVISNRSEKTKALAKQINKKKGSEIGCIGDCQFHYPQGLCPLINLVGGSPIRDQAWMLTPKAISDGRQNAVSIPRNII